MSGFVVKRPRGKYLAYYAASIGALAVILSVSGAYDTDNLSLVHRLTLFAVVSGLLIIQASALDGVCRNIFYGGFLMRCAAALITMLITLALMTLELHALKFTPLLPKPPDPLLPFALFLAPVVGAGVGLVVLFKSPDAARVAVLEPLEIGYEKILELSEHPVVSGLLPPPAPEALADWPTQAVEQVVSRDHYLEIQTAAGRQLIRGRMKDALARLKSQDGVQPHRSWWIRADQIRRMSRRGRDFVLVLTDGVEIPVARGRLQAIRKRLEQLDID